MRLPLLRATARWTISLQGLHALASGLYLRTAIRRGKLQVRRCYFPVMAMMTARLTRFSSSRMFRAQPWCSMARRAWGVKAMIPFCFLTHIFAGRPWPEKRMSPSRSRQGGMGPRLHPQSVVKVFTETPVFEGLLKIRVRCGQNARIDVNPLRPLPPG